MSRQYDGPHTTEVIGYLAMTAGNFRFVGGGGFANQGTTSQQSLILAPSHLETLKST